ncbi:hypothetical protein SAMN05421752_1028 [Natronorubrum thiooxidans]|uniref:Uncharacterized protein n=1 Tax=Natronorubrum thiooxidans TaxID=308853 RepID=A0A1N7D6S1_9EURY|nr:hypothetical protein SAMN05421752_1028 [Natronorubrum thiooxidans]
MRQGSINYFFGSLFSRQAIYAYGIAGGITTVFQLLLLWANYFTEVPTRTESFPVFVELYIETLLPLWIPPITPWNAAMLLTNAFLMLMILAQWTINYDRAF